jgi:serine/threonine protein phosphatase PrpC
VAAARLALAGERAAAGERKFGLDTVNAFLIDPVLSWRSLEERHVHLLVGGLFENDPAARLQAEKSAMACGITPAQILSLKTALGEAFRCDSLVETRNVSCILPGDMLSPTLGVNFDGTILAGERKMGVSRLLLRVKEIVRREDEAASRAEAVWRYLSGVIGQTRERNAGQVDYNFFALVAQLAFQETGIASKLIQGYTCDDVDGEDKVEDIFWLELTFPDGNKQIIDPRQEDLLEEGDLSSDYYPPDFFPNRVFRPISYLPGMDRRQIIGVSAKRAARNEILHFNRSGIPKEVLFARTGEEGREGNEDCVGMDFSGPLALLKIADGIGGSAEHSEEASWRAMLAMRRAFKEGGGVAEVMSYAAFATWAHNVLHPLPAVGFGRQPQTTAVALLYDRVARNAAILHEGDSRGYLIREDGIWHLTVDHVGATRGFGSVPVPLGLMDRRFLPSKGYLGRLTLWEYINAAEGKDRSLSHRLGLNPSEVWLPQSTVAVQPGDVFLLTTDAINEVLTVKEFALVCEEARGHGAEALVQALFRALNRRKDNFSAVALDILALDKYFADLGAEE